MHLKRPINDIIYLDIRVIGDIVYKSSACPIFTIPKGTTVMGMTPRVRIAFCALLALFVLCIVMALSPAQAEPQCTDYKTIQATLLEKFHETPSAAGLAAEGKAAYTVFSSPDGASWTLVIVGVGGKSCIVAAGDHWVDLSPGKGEPT